MADNILNTSPILSVCATTGERLKELTIKDGQLVFVQDKQWIALDFNGKRKFYYQIELLETDYDRTNLLAPITDRFYFIIETAILWTYHNGWVQITSKPEEIVFIGTEMPELGSEKTLYVNKEARNISIYDAEASAYKVVADYTRAADDADIDALFS